jgi:hypothetical protein
MVDPNIQTIIKYKSFFQKESINEVIQNIEQHKFQDIYINKNYAELVGVDIPIEYSPTEIPNYHLSTDINPLIAQKIVDKAFENNVPIHFADFNPPNPVWEILVHTPDYIIPFLAISLILRIVFSFFSGSLSYVIS